GSLGIDLESAVTITLMTSTPEKIPTTTHGPLEPTKTVGALLIGRSSTGLNGLVVLPGVIDADYTGQICVIAFALQPPLTIEKGMRIAQLVLYERHPTTPIAHIKERGQQGFGSTGDHLINPVQKMTQRPQLPITLRHQTSSHLVTAMCDTGANVTIIS
ncbi:POK9 protein, partial [Scytalopus superciliaris]|nr:POK9 protein [Scytalopus superciliaris]